MTIETPMSFPEGGTECPPDENPLPASRIRTISSSSPRRSSSEESTYESSNTDYKIFLIDGNKGKKDISNSLHANLRSCRSTPLLQVSKNDESSEQILKTIAINNNEVDVEYKCTNGTSSSETDRKKPFRQKHWVADGSKEEATSRKSMRLRLRRGKTDNSDDFSGPKQRRRYVEDLISINFDDDNLKVMFMDVLGMSLRSKRAKLLPETSSSNPASISSLSSLVKQEKVPEIRAEKRTYQASSSTNSNGSPNGKNQMVELSAVLLANHEDEDRIKFSESNISNVTIEGAADTAGMLKPPPAINKDDIANDNADDDEGWECWVKRLSSSKAAEPVNTSPTKKEINESLIRLVRLGTVVKIVGSGVS